MKEGTIQTQISKTLTQHPHVAWHMTITTGTIKMKGGFFKNIGKHFKHRATKSDDGTSDIIGQLICGTSFAIEVKVPGEEPTEDQYAFLNTVIKNNGRAGWATTVAEALDIIE